MKTIVKDWFVIGLICVSIYGGWWLGVNTNIPKHVCDQACDQNEIFFPLSRSERNGMLPGDIPTIELIRAHQYFDDQKYLLSYYALIQTRTDARLVSDHAVIADTYVLENLIYNQTCSEIVVSEQ